MKDKFLKIINTFEINPQLKKFNEECFELIEAIRDYEEQYVICDGANQYLKYEKEHIAEEIADCLVLLNQFKEYYEIDDIQLNVLVESKVDRTLKRIEEKYYEK